MRTINTNHLSNDTNAPKPPFSRLISALTRADHLHIYWLTTNKQYALICTRSVQLYANPSTCCYYVMADHFPRIRNVFECAVRAWLVNHVCGAYKITALVPEAPRGTYSNSISMCICSMHTHSLPSRLGCPEGLCYNENKTPSTCGV